MGRNGKNLEKWEDEMFGTTTYGGDEITEYENKIEYSFKVNTASYEILFKYINQKINNPSINTEEHDGFIVKHIIKGSDFITNIPNPAPKVLNYNVLISYMGEDIIMNAEAYMDNGELKQWIEIHSKGKLSITGDGLYEKFFNLALQKSSLKGSYFTMPNNEFQWNITDLAQMSYDDIFLPNDLMDNAKMYVELYKQKGLMSRYMLSGIPGTGKTELTRVLSSILNEDGVTIIKTNPCEKLKEKVDLARILAPAIIIMDDVDLYLGNRNNGTLSSLLGQFLDVLDGVDKLPDNVGIIASTNAPHLIDIAAQRPGRFNKMLFFDKLTKENIKGIIAKSLKNLVIKYGPINKKVSTKLTSDAMVDYFLKSEETGSYIYETIIAIKNKMDIMDENDIDVNELIISLTNERKQLREKLKVDNIKATFDGEKKSMGFN